MKYKYEDVENVTAKRDFELFIHDESGDIERVVTVPNGCKGVVKSMGFNMMNNHRITYEILFIEGNTEVNASIYEEDMEIYFDLNKEGTK